MTVMHSSAVVYRLASQIQVHTLAGAFLCEVCIFSLYSRTLASSSVYSALRSSVNK